MSIRTRLTVLVALAAAPPLALVAYNTLEWRTLLERQAGDDALASARLVAAELAQLMEGAQHLMRAIIHHPSVPDIEAECSAHFTNVFKRISLYHGAALIDRSGNVRCASLPVPSNVNVADRAYFTEALKTGRFTIGNVTTGRASGGRALHLATPYKSEDGSFDGIVVLALNPGNVATEFGRRAWPENHRVSVLDRAGQVVFMIPPSDQYEMPAATREAFDRFRAGQGSTYITRRSSGTDEITSLVRVDAPAADLFVAVSIDLDVALAGLWDITWRSMILALIAILVALLGATVAGAWLLRRPILAMVETARRREAGDTTAQFPRLSRSSEFGHLSQALSAMSARVDGLLEQKEFLLRELQHRVMNSLQILSSLLLMQSRHAQHAETREQLKNARDRVLSMGMVYRHLYNTETVGPVEFGDFLRLICSESENAYGGSKISCEAEPLFVTGGTATSLAVLLHELITNALKYAYPDDRPGEIQVSLRRKKKGIEFRVRDGGNGLPENFDPESSGSLGFKVITSTVRRFGGTLTFNRLNPGTEFVITFPAGIEVEGPDTAAAAAQNSQQEGGTKSA